MQAKSSLSRIETQKLIDNIDGDAISTSKWGQKDGKIQVCGVGVGCRVQVTVIITVRCLGASLLSL